MKLKQFTPSEIPNTKGARGGGFSVHMNAKTGLIRFSKSAQERLSLNPEDKVLFCQDEESPEDWYVVVGRKIDGFTLRLDKASNLLMNCRFVVRQIFQSADFTGSSGHAMIGAEPKVVNKASYWPLITASLNK